MFDDDDNDDIRGREFKAERAIIVVVVASSSAMLLSLFVRKKMINSKIKAHKARIKRFLRFRFGNILICFKKIHVSKKDNNQQ